jgi:hypothetical protein
MPAVPVLRTLRLYDQEDLRILDFFVPICEHCAVNERRIVVRDLVTIEGSRQQGEIDFHVPLYHARVEAMNDRPHLCEPSIFLLLRLGHLRYRLELDARF